MRDRVRSRAGGFLAALAAALGVSFLAACGGPAPAQADPTPQSAYFQVMPLCTPAQLTTAADGTAHRISVISGQTVHVTVGEEFNVWFNLVRTPPDSQQVTVRTGVGALCRRSPLIVKGTSQTFPLLAAQAGRAEFLIRDGTTENSYEHDVIWVDAAKAG